MVQSKYQATISAREATGLIPRLRSGKRMHVSTFIRWHQQGKKMPDGSTIRLWMVRIGNVWATCPEAISDFIAACNPEVEEQGTEQPIRTPTARRKASENAEQELIAQGM